MNSINSTSKLYMCSEHVQLVYRSASRLDTECYVFINQVIVLVDVSGHLMSSLFQLKENCY